MPLELWQLIQSVPRTFGLARAQSFKGHPWPRSFERDAEEALGDFAQSRDLKLTTGTGKGAWPEILWIGLGDKRLAPNGKAVST